MKKGKGKAAAGAKVPEKKGKAAGNSKLPGAIVLIGPTGSGKTPLGEYMQRYGFMGRRTMHFDFGHHLRMVVAGQEPTPLLTQKDVEFIVGVLESGVLLEDEHFHIAQRILKNFLSMYSLTKDDLVILNGLPRHEGQARDVEKIVNVKALIVLDCTAHVVKSRIESNIGGDRKARPDDNIKAIERRLRIFQQRTMSMINYYQGLGVKAARVKVGEASKPDELAKKAAAELAACKALKKTGVTAARSK
ncbi:MAG: hypothetical protein C0404_15010 [Verrucomicrobia bacterium]|nr:hypothetical protein [Verrucomicrobiota bacterium]